MSQKENWKEHWRTYYHPYVGTDLMKYVYDMWDHSIKRDYVDEAHYEVLKEFLGVR